MSEHEGGNLIQLGTFRDKKLGELGDNLENHRRRAYALARRAVKLLRANRVSSSLESVRVDNGGEDKKNVIETDGIISYSILRKGYHNFIFSSESSGSIKDRPVVLTKIVSVTTGLVPNVIFSSTSGMQASDSTYKMSDQVNFQNNTNAYKMSMKEIEGIESHSK